MQILELCNNKDFLGRLFPEGLTEDVYLGQIMLSMEGRCVINIHTKQRPAIEIPKWGKWGEEYNVVVIIVSATGCRSIGIDNWQLGYYSPLELVLSNDKKFLSQKNSEWSLLIEFDSLQFQKCDTYLDSTE